MRRGPLFRSVALATTIFAFPALGGERELDRDTPPASTDEIEAPLERVFPEEPDRRPLFPQLRERLQDLTPFLADTRLEARYRTYYLRLAGTEGQLRYAWAMGGSIAYHSGWLADLFAIEAEGFTSQPIVAPEDRGGTLLLEPVQDGYSVLGIANAKLRYNGIVLTGFRQYLDLPYVNRQDSRMTPNTFESITLAKPEGPLRFSAGYSWKIKRRNSDAFRSFTKAVGVNRDRGLAHAGVIWDPLNGVSLGVVGAGVPDLFTGLYAELSASHEFVEGLEGRLDTQFTYQWESGDDLLGTDLDDTWSLGVRTSASYSRTVLRLGLSVTGSNGSIISLYGTNPSYVDLMQRSFTAENEKALLASLSYDFSDLGADGLSAIVNFVAAFDGTLLGVRRDAQEVDLTIDYRPKRDWLQGFWLRLRGSWLHVDSGDQDGKEIRVILRYDFPVI